MLVAKETLPVGDHKYFPDLPLRGSIICY